MKRKFLTYIVKSLTVFFLFFFTTNVFAGYWEDYIQFAGSTSVGGWGPVIKSEGTCQNVDFLGGGGYGGKWWYKTPCYGYIGPLTPSECKADLGGIIKMVATCQKSEYVKKGVVIPDIYVKIVTEWKQNMDGKGYCGYEEEIEADQCLYTSSSFGLVRATFNGENTKEKCEAKGEGATYQTYDGFDSQLVEKTSKWVTNNDWPTLQRLFAPYYMWLWSQQSESIASKLKYPYFVNTNKEAHTYVGDPVLYGKLQWNKFDAAGAHPQKKLTEEEACFMMFNKATVKMVDFAATGITKANCVEKAIACSSYEDQCNLPKGLRAFRGGSEEDNPLTPATTDETEKVCAWIFKDHVDERVGRYFKGCLNIITNYKNFSTLADGDANKTKACKELKEMSPFYGLCTAPGAVMKWKPSVANSKEQCCTVAHTMDAYWSREKLTCAVTLNKELADSCVCRLPPNNAQTFAFEKNYEQTKGMGECCSLCKQAPGKFNPSTISFNGTDDRCGFKGVGDITQPGIAKFQSPLRAGIISPQTFIGNLIKVLLGIVGSLAFAMVVWGGFQWMTSAGSSERIKSGQQTVMWAVFGLVAIFISYGVVNVLLGLG